MEHSPQIRPEEPSKQTRLETWFKSQREQQDSEISKYYNDLYNLLLQSKGFVAIIESVSDEIQKNPNFLEFAYDYLSSELYSDPQDYIKRMSDTIFDKQSLSEEELTSKTTEFGNLSPDVIRLDADGKLKYEIVENPSSDKTATNCIKVTFKRKNDAGEGKTFLFSNRAASAGELRGNILVEFLQELGKNKNYSTIAEAMLNSPQHVKSTKMNTHVLIINQADIMGKTQDLVDEIAAPILSEEIITQAQRESGIATDEGFDLEQGIINLLSKELATKLSEKCYDLEALCQQFKVLHGSKDNGADQDWSEVWLQSQQSYCQKIRDIVNYLEAMKNHKNQSVETEIRPEYLKNTIEETRTLLWDFMKNPEKCDVATRLTTIVKELKENDPFWEAYEASKEDMLNYIARLQRYEAQGFEVVKGQESLRKAIDETDKLLQSFTTNPEECDVATKLTAIVQELEKDIKEARSQSPLMNILYRLKATATRIFRKCETLCHNPQQITKLTLQVQSQGQSETKYGRTESTGEISDSVNRKNSVDSLDSGKAIELDEISVDTGDDVKSQRSIHEGVADVSPPVSPISPKSGAAVKNEDTKSPGP